MMNHYIQRTILLTGFTLFITPNMGSANYTPYCGVYCVHIGSQILGFQSELENLIDPKYVASFDGSTIQDLSRACEACNIPHLSLIGLSIFDLDCSKSPMILHVRRPGFRTDYTHWILYTGKQGDHYRIYDPYSNHYELYSPAELAALWDGVAMVMMKEQSTLFMYKLKSILTQLELPIYLLFSLTFLRWLTLKNNRLQLILIPLFTILVIVVWHRLHSLGMLQNPAAVATVKINHFRPDIEELFLDDFRKLLETEKYTLVDARTTDAYRSGKILSAIHLSIDSSLMERVKVAASIPSGQLVIVYCQSDSCTWADSIAIDLYHRGHSNIKIYRGGMNEWSRNSHH